MDLVFYFQMGLLVLEHAKPEVLQSPRLIQVLQAIKDTISTIPGIK